MNIIAESTPSPAPSLSEVMFDARDASQYAPTPARGVDQSLAEAFTEQVDSFYSIPRKPYERKEIVFSPSGVSKCARELYYMHTGAPVDEQPLVPWRERMSRNGTAVHDATQHDYFRMERALRELGHGVRFRFLEAEIKGERSYMVGPHKVTLKGRADGKLGVLNDAGEVIEIIGWEKKTKDKMTNLKKIMKAGVQDDHRRQTVSYALIWGIQKWLFEYEALQKPQWSKVEETDTYRELVVVEREEAKQLLNRLARVVDFIEKRELPPPELDRCGFCPFKTQCHKDGGYQG